MAQTILQDLIDYLTCCPMGIKLLRISASGTNESLANFDDGTATVTVLTGTAPYTYLWSNGATTQSITGLTPATYTVTVTDNKGRVRQASYTVVPAVATLPARYVFESGSIPISRANLETNYLTGELDATSIEATFGVGAPGTQEVLIYHHDGTTFTSDSFFANITNPTTFWNDILGWMQMNNFYDISLNLGLNQYSIDDPANNSYLQISMP